MPWTISSGFRYKTVTDAIATLTAKSKEAGWTHLGIYSQADGTFNLDTDWLFPDLSTVMDKISKLAAIAEFTSATVRMTK